MLSRVTWPPFEASDSVTAIKDAWARGDFKRICLQVVNGEKSWSATLDALESFKKDRSIPLCVSGHFDTVEQARELIDAGAERICIALDAATPGVYSMTKEGNWEKRWQLLVECLPNGHMNFR